jgi:hypothetical protein
LWLVLLNNFSRVFREFLFARGLVLLDKF